MRVFAVIALTVIIVLAGYWLLKTRILSSPRSLTFGIQTMSEVVKIKTQDNVEIIGDYYTGGSSGVLLLHMMPANRKSWVKFAEKLQQAGFSVLAVDLRGHGESQGGPDGYKRFLDEEHQSSYFDVEAAAAFLKSKGITALHIAGASIGANLALGYAVKNRETRSVILLSPGLDYRGVKTELLISRLNPEQGIFLAASKDDNYSFDTVERLAQKISPDNFHQLKIFEDSGHGTTILEKTRNL